MENVSCLERCRFLTWGQLTVLHRVLIPDWKCPPGTLVSLVLCPFLLLMISTIKYLWVLISRCGLGLTESSNCIRNSKRKLAVDFFFFNIMDLTVKNQAAVGWTYKAFIEQTFVYSTQVVTKGFVFFNCKLWIHSVTGKKVNWFLCAV